MDIYLEVVEPAFWNSKIFEIRVTLQYIANTADSAQEQYS